MFGAPFPSKSLVNFVSGIRSLSDSVSKSIFESESKALFDYNSVFTWDPLLVSLE